MFSLVMFRSAVALVTLFPGALFAQQGTTGCANLSGYVYRMKLYDARGPVEDEPRGFAAGFFVSPEGDFITALHTFEQSWRVSAALVELYDGTKWFDAAIEAVTGYSRKLDILTARVRLGGARIRVAPLGSSARVGGTVTGFMVGPPLPAGWERGEGISCTQGRISAVSGGEMVAVGENLFLPGSSGSPVFDSSGRVVAVALQMIDSAARGRPPKWDYVGLPVSKLPSVPKLPAPIPVSALRAALRRR